MNEKQTVFGEKKWLLWAAVLVIFTVGLAIRFYDLADAPLDFHPTRQLHSASDGTRYVLRKPYRCAGVAA